MENPTIEELTALCKSVQGDIDDECRAYDDDEEPGILLTVGADGKDGWGFQTGDTQFHGGAYGFPHWGQAAIRRDTDCTEAAQTILDEIEESIAQGE